ncbi:hypothetical protein OC845_000259 [Tilletia horrida]|nr:hypothetical protein OC845_000259 [Tilletia horrida]
MVLTYYRAHGPSSSSSSSYPRQRIDTLAIKAQLGAALGENQLHYWHALRSFCTAALDRAEFEQLARGYLGNDLIHLHNALIMGILHNASPGVPGPSTDDDPLGTTSSSKRRKPGDPDLTAVADIPIQKRQRIVLAGLPKRERQRLKQVGKLARGPTATAAAGSAALGSALGPTLSAASAAGAAANAGSADPAAGGENAALLAAAGVGWAGANAEMLERKRKEQEKRKAIEEKRRVRETLTSIGAKDWREQTKQEGTALEEVKDKLSASTQSAIARALSASLCIDSKELPDIGALRDRMTLHAVEAGLPGGVHPQAAAMVLLALQGHIQNVIASVVGKLRARGTRSAMSEGADISAAAAAQAAATAAKMAQDEADAELDAELGLDEKANSVFSVIENWPQPTSASATSKAPPLLRRTSSSAALRPMTSTYQSENTPSVARDNFDDDHTVKLSDMAMLFDLAPQTVVEPLGLGTQERMLAPEYEGNLDLTGAESPRPGSYGGYGGKAGRGVGAGLLGSTSDDDEDAVAAAI